MCCNGNNALTSLIFLFFLRTQRNQSDGNQPQAVDVTVQLLVICVAPSALIHKLSTWNQCERNLISLLSSSISFLAPARFFKL